MDFELCVKTKVHFGTNILEKALIAEKENIYGKILIVTTGRSLIKNGYVDTICRILRMNENVDQVLVYDKISGNPKLGEVKEAVDIGKKSGVNIIIGFGGGSAIDAAKAVAVGVGTEKHIEEFLFDGKEPGAETLPIIAIPTTAGTGSELSKGAIITSTERKVKAGIRGANILPSIAIVDSSYTVTVPEKISMETGFDVMAHAIESYVSTKANAFSEMLSEKAIQIVAKYLPAIKNDLHDIGAREQLSYASMIMGINLANVGTCLPHRMQYPIGGVTESSHAAGLVALYPSWIYHQYGVNETKINKVLQCMGLGYVESAEEAKEQFKYFMDSLRLNYTLKEIGISGENIDTLCEKVTGNLRNDKLANTQDIIKSIYLESL